MLCACTVCSYKCAYVCVYMLVAVINLSNRMFCHLGRRLLYIHIYIYFKPLPRLQPVTSPTPPAAIPRKSNPMGQSFCLINRRLHRGWQQSLVNGVDLRRRAVWHSNNNSVQCHNIILCNIQRDSSSIC